jgi:hypothetical protein
MAALLLISDVQDRVFRGALMAHLLANNGVYPQ